MEEEAAPADKKVVTPETAKKDAKKKKAPKVDLPPENKSNSTFRASTAGKPILKKEVYPPLHVYKQKMP